MRDRPQLVLGGAGAAALMLLCNMTPADAHPHVWVAVETTVIYDKGTIAGLRQRWTFDELYTTMAIEGLDTNKDGKFDRSELAELAKINMEGLKEFDYFTFVRLGEQALAFDAPKDVWMEHGETATPPGPQNAMVADPSLPKPAEQQGGFWSKLSGALSGGKGAEPEKPKVVSLVFTLPLQQPVLAEAQGLTFSTADPTFFIWFDLAAGNPIKFSEGAPAGCKATIADPQQGGGDLQKLAEQVTAPAGGQTGGQGFAVSTGKVVSVSCGKS